MSAHPLERLDQRPIPDDPAEIRLLVVVRDEELRLPYFLEHHRRIGVDRFVVVDNGSLDGTLDFLHTQPDVHLYRAAGSFLRERHHWKQALLDAHFRDRWSLVIDADELFVFPRMERADLRAFCRHLEAEGARGVHATMIDMYGDGAIRDAKYEAGRSPLETCPFFDGDGYWLQYEPLYKRRNHERAPDYTVRGGPRHRLFFAGGAGPGVLARPLARWLYDIRRTAPPAASRSRATYKLIRRAAGRVWSDKPPAMSKVPLVRWGSDLRVENPSFHYLTPAVPLSRCWAALLHFKYLHDFDERVDEALARKQHADASAQYRHYRQRLDDEPGLRPFGPGSRRYQSSQSLLDLGLMRSSPDWEAWVSAQGHEASSSPWGGPA